MDKARSMYARSGSRYEAGNMNVQKGCVDGISIYESAVLKFMCALITTQNNGKYDPVKVAKDAVALADAFTNVI